MAAKTRQEVASLTPTERVAVFGKYARGLAWFKGKHLQKHESWLSYKNTKNDDHW